VTTTTLQPEDFCEMRGSDGRCGKAHTRAITVGATKVHLCETCSPAAIAKRAFQSRAPDVEEPLVADPEAPWTVDEGDRAWSAHFMRVPDVRASVYWYAPKQAALWSVSVGMPGVRVFEVRGDNADPEVAKSEAAAVAHVILRDIAERAMAALPQRVAAKFEPKCEHERYLRVWCTAGCPGTASHGRPST
jgi:hypothetical protein